MADLTPWDKQPGETELWYDRFCLYRDMGVARNFFGGYQLWLKHNGKYTEAESVKSTPGAWQRKSKEFAWKDRATSWDQEQRRARQARNDQRLIDLEDEEYRLGIIMLKEGQKMLEWPLTERTVEDEGKTIIFKPAGWSKSTVDRFIKCGADMARRAIGAVPSGEMGGAKAGEGELPDDQRDLNDIEWLVDAMPELAVDAPTK